ncbi:hypothetical protein D3C74_408150 [compost metagenome]
MKTVRTAYIFYFAIRIPLNKGTYFRLSETLRVAFDPTIAVAPGFSDFHKPLKVKNPMAKANATLLHIQILHYAAHHRSIVIL